MRHTLHPPRRRAALGMLTALLAWLPIAMQAQTTLCTTDSLRINLTGQTGSIQWESSTDGGATWNPIPGATSASLLDFPTQATWYRAAVTSGTCNPFYSDTTAVNRTDLAANAGGPQIICGGNPGTLGGSPSASGGAAPYTYLWTLPNGSLSSSSAANPTATITTNTTATLMVTDANGCVATDNAALTFATTAPPGADTFLYTGSLQTFIVPACVDSIWIECWGAQGGAVTGQPPYPQGGLGARMKGRFAVTPGQSYNVVVGARGNPDPSSSGGGGGSGVGLGATPLIVAGGGAGHDFQDPGYTGVHAVVTGSGVPGNGSGSGAGGIGGADGGDHIYSGAHISRGGRGWNSGNSGSTGQDGVSANTSHTNGTWGLGGGGGSVGYGWCNCGGGGGGYSGGGSAAINQSGGGGGSYNTGTNQNNSGGVNTGNGRVIITW